MSDAVYKISVEMALAGGLTQALAAVAGQMTGIHGLSKRVVDSFGGWGPALVGVGAIIAGGVILHGIEDIYEATKNLSHELTQIEKMGINPGQMGQVRAQALDVIRKVPGVTEIDALAMYGQTYSMLGHDEAIKEMEPLSRFAQVLGNTTGDYEAANKSVYSMIRSADLIGKLSDPITRKLDPERLQHFLDVATRIAQATHGQIGPSQWLAVAQQGGPSLRGLTDGGLISQVIIAQAMGAHRAGTASMSMFQQFAGGTMYKRNAEAMEELGLLKKGEWSVSGGRVVMKNDASKRLMNSLVEDPLKFITDTLMPQLQKKGITDINDQIREIFRVFMRQTTQRMTADELMNFNQMLSERSRIATALGALDAFNVQNAKDLEQAERNVSAAFMNLKLAIGGPESEHMVAVINSIASAIRGFTEIVRSVEASGIGSHAFDLVKFSGFFLTIRALGWLADKGPELQKAASAIHSVIDEIGSTIGRITGGISGWFKSNGGGAAKDELPQGGGQLRGAPPASEGLLHRQSFIAPHRDTKPIITTTALNIDGRALAEQVSQHLAELYEFPTQAPYPDGQSTAYVPDTQMG